MKVHANVMIKDEELLLQQVLPIWDKYEIDEWVFYNDNSVDRTVELIRDTFGGRATIFNDHLPRFHEAHQRSRMFEHSRESGADFAIAIDADELMSTTLVNDFHRVLEMNTQYNIMYYWYNVVDDLNHYRQDPMYINNYRTFAVPLANAGKFDLAGYKYHTPRTPPVSLRAVATKEYGFVHLQSINKKYYALKQLWYKHYEYKEYGHTIEQINSRYDPVVNGLDFMERETPKKIIEGITFDASVYDKMAEIKGYKQYILENKVDDLLTFGGEYL
jgi:hypothetical protein